MRNLNEDRKRVTINVAGLIFETFDETLQRFPDTLLGNTEKLSLHYSHQSQEYFFDRSRVCFEYILRFYQTSGNLKCPPGEDVETFESECRYFELPRAAICKMLIDEGIVLDITGHEPVEQKSLFRYKMWKFLELPQSSTASWWFGVFSMSMVCISILTACLETTDMWRQSLHNVDIVLNVWFLAEFLLRFHFTRSKVSFFKHSMTWVDMLAVAPYFIVIGLTTEAQSLSCIFNTLKVMKVIRLFHFTKLSCPLKIVGHTLQVNSLRMVMLMLTLFIGILVGGTLVYVMENTHFVHRNPGLHNNITSIPDGLWWSVQTVSTVGYGDLIPITVFGKISSCCFMLFGVLTLIPLLSIASDFKMMFPKNMKYYRTRVQSKQKEKYTERYINGRSSEVGL